ncbi:DUF2076 domain-containing protein, partial [Falsiroseomonas oryzae]|uniref:DUF2076 domain-containing protein n=1 Tax=Falsiroseomonas oryzae TaxID=2766473 RepID=UPI0022EA711B
PASPWGALGGGAQPAQPQLPPVDPEADRLIGDLFARHPEARYRLTQMAFVQEAALVEMQNRIQQLEWEVENARNQGQAAQSRGMFGGMFGGGSRPAPMRPRPQPQYPPGYNPAMMQRGGPGFLGTAMMTAAGVAGGLLLGNALMSAFSGGGAAEAATSGAFGQDAVPTSSAWTDPGAAQQDAHGQDAYGEDAQAYDEGGGYDEEI